MLSQNTKQYNKHPKAYSYTIYDELGRVVEAGEKRDYNSFSGSGSQHGESFSMIFGDTIATHYNPDVINDDSLQAWIYHTDGIRTEVTHSWYDVTDSNIGTGLPGYFTQANLRKRIAHVTYEDTLDTDTTTYDHATHYTYDIHGNVNTLLQDNQKLATEYPDLASQQFKRMDYTYDLISGNVHHVAYQKDSADVWHHAYEYDADNRITDVYTSHQPLAEEILPSDGSSISGLWDHDAKYFYYAHGPLARVETGDLQVQGTDYAYTLQGWIKGVNSTTLDSLRDIGKDGWRDSSNVNFNFPRDVYGYSLNYFTNDYTAIDPTVTGTDHFLASLTHVSNGLIAYSWGLYNGNIRSMATTITNPTTRAILPMGSAYRYDQLNRLIESRSFEFISMAGNFWGYSSGSDYDYLNFNKFSYDANGNILTQLRNDNTAAQIDNLTYKYAKNTDGRTIQNRLYHVDDTESAGSFSDDIDDMGTFTSTLSSINTANTYSFDEIGELKKDAQEQILQIVWRVDGKVKEVYRTAGSSKKNLKFDYDAMGNRIAKHIYASDSTWERSTYYNRDAQGNTMSVYEYTYDDIEEEVSYKLNEQHIYGSSRLGMRTDTLEMIAAIVDTSYFTRTLVKKQYEFSNHLGNVLTVISDKKIPQDLNNDSIVDYFTAHILTASDYSPFGVTLNNRDFTSEDYRYGFNGMEKDDEVKGNGNSYDFGARLLDPRLGRWLSIDPKYSVAPWMSTYGAQGDNPILFIDINGEIIEWATDEKSQETKNKVLELVSSSELFAAVYYYLDGLPDIIKVTTDDKTVQESYQKATKGSPNFAGGFARLSSKEIFFSEIYADESTYSEEFFHQFQSILRETDKANQPNMDAEAKVFNQAVALEIYGRQSFDQKGIDGCEVSLIDAVKETLNNVVDETISILLMNAGSTALIFEEIIVEENNTSLIIKPDFPAMNAFLDFLSNFKELHTQTDNDPYGSGNNTEAQPKSYNEAVEKAEEK